MRLFGYARVSSHKQSLDLQVQQLKAEGIEPHRILTDVSSGKNKDRTGLEELLIKVEKGDKIVVTKLDRLGRNTMDMIKIIESLNERGVTVRFISEGLETGGTLGMMTITILSAVAEAERGRLMERCREGQLAAMEKGVVFGQKIKIDYDKVVELHESGMSAIKIGKELGIDRSSVYRILKMKMPEDIKKSKHKASK